MGVIYKEDAPNARQIDCSGLVILPGFVQTHIHMAQVLFRGLGEGMNLLHWLSQRVLPLEASHDPDTLYASARLGIAELLLGGNTAMLDFGSVHHADAIFEAAKDMGIRLTAGKIMMDRGKAVPAKLKQSTDEALQGSVELYERYHGTENGCLRYAFTPRFLLSCTPDVMRESLKLAAEHDTIWHTHIAEQVPEIQTVMDETGKFSLGLPGRTGRVTGAFMPGTHDSPVFEGTQTDAQLAGGRAALSARQHKARLRRL